MAPISPSASFLLPINHRGSFFEDTYFQDAREDFHSAVRDVLTRRDRGRGGDKSRDLSCYRRLRQQEDFDEDSQALTITEDEENRKILLDVKEFHPDGDVKVHALSDQELLVEGRHQDPKTARVRSFSRRFMLPRYADLSCGFFSVDISSDGVLRIVTTKKVPSAGRSIPLILDYQDMNENVSHQESYITTNINSNINSNSNSKSNRNSNSNSRNVSFSASDSYEEGFNHKRATDPTVNSNSGSVHCTSQQDIMREVPQNNTKGKIIPVVFVKSENNEESNKFSQSSSLTQETTAATNHKGSVQYSTNRNRSSSTSTNKNRPINAVITTTFDVKSNSNEGIPAKTHEIVIPINIQSKTSDQKTDSKECTKQKQPNRNVPVSNGIPSIHNPVNKIEQNEDLSSQNSKVKQIIPVTIEKKKDKTKKDADSSKSKTAQKKCFMILNKKAKPGTSDKHKKDITKDSKRNTHPKEFIIPLTIEGDSLDEKLVQKEAVKKVVIGRQDQTKTNNGNKPPIKQNKKPTSPQPKKISISNIFMGEDDQKKEIKTSVTSENKQSNRSESTSNKPPPSPRNEKKHYRSSSIEERVTIFTRMSPATERKSRRDFMDEIRGNSRGARSRSSSIEDLIVKFDKMSPQAERRVLNRKNSQEENTEHFEKNQVVKRKESIIPIEIEGDTEKNNSVSKQNFSQNSYSNNNVTDTYDIASHNEKFNRMGENENKENSNTQGINPIVKRKESIIPIKMEYEEDDENSFHVPISQGSSSVDATTKENDDVHTLSNLLPKVEYTDKISKGFISDHSKVSNVSETENGNIYSSNSSINIINKENSGTGSSPFISNDSSYDKYIKVNNDDEYRVSSIPSSSIIEDDNSLESADEDSKKTLKGKTKKSSKRKVKRKQSIPGVQVSDDETGEMTMLLSERSSSATGRKKKNVNNPSGSLRDADDHCNSSQSVNDSNCSSLINISVEAYNETEGTVDSLTSFSNENISRTKESSVNIGKEMSSSIPEVKDLTNYSEPNDTNSSNLLLQKEQSNTCNMINSMSDSYYKNSLTKTVHDYSNLSDKCNESPRKGKVYRRTSVSQLVSDDSGSEGSGASSLHQSRSKFRESRASVRISSKIRSDKSPTDPCINNKNYSNCSDLSESTDIEKLTPNTEVISDGTSFEISDNNMSSEKIDTENIKSKNSKEKSIEKMELRRSSVLPSPSDLLKIKPPKKNKKENSETNESSKNDTVELNKNEKTEQNLINLKESRRASTLLDSSDLLKIKPPKKSVPQPNAESKKSVSSENYENSKSSLDIHQPKDNPTESEQQFKQTDSQQTKTSKNTQDLVTKDNLDTDKMESRRSSVLPNPSDLLKIKPPKKNKKEKSETNDSSKNNKFESNKNENTEQNSINLKESRRASVLPDPADLLNIKPPKKSVTEPNASSTKSVSSENSINLKESRRASVLPDPADLLNIKPPKKSVTEPNASSNKSVSSENSINLKESRRASVLPDPSDLLNIKLPKKSVTEPNASSNKSVSSENSINFKESRRASVLPDPTDLLNIKPPKKRVTEPSASSNKPVSSENSINLKESRRASVLPDPINLLNIKPSKKSVTELNSSSKKFVSSENSENSKSSQDIHQPKDKPIESEQQQNQTDSQQTQTSNSTYDLVTKNNLNTDKENDNRALENILENTLNPETVNNSDNSTTNLRRKTSFKKFRVFDNKRTASPSPIRRPDSLTPSKTEQFIINKIEENSTYKKEEVNNRKEEKSLIKNEPLSSSKKSKINACVNIENKDMFFSDPFFKDHRQLFMGGVREALKRSGITSMRDKLRVYRELRLKGQTEDNQAICSAEDETSYKAVLDMTEFLEGEINVKTMSSTEVVIEGISKSGNKSTPFSHSLPFPDSINMEAVEASLSEDGILAINAPKTNPDTEV